MRRFGAGQQERRDGGGVGREARPEDGDGRIQSGAQVAVKRGVPQSQLAADFRLAHGLDVAQLHHAVTGPLGAVEGDIVLRAQGLQRIEEQAAQLLAGGGAGGVEQAQFSGQAAGLQGAGVVEILKSILDGFLKRFAIDGWQGTPPSGGRMEKNVLFAERTGCQRRG